MVSQHDLSTNTVMQEAQKHGQYQPYVNGAGNPNAFKRLVADSAAAVAVGTLPAAEVWEPPQEDDRAETSHDYE